MKLQELRFGVEIETIKRSRGDVARAIQSVVGGNAEHVGRPKWKSLGIAAIITLTTGLLVSEHIHIAGKLPFYEFATIGSRSTGRGRPMAVG